MKNFAVIGNPISQSLSPLMHNWIFNTLGLEAKYEKIKVGKNDLPQIIQQLKEEKWNGITILIRGRSDGTVWRGEKSMIAPPPQHIARIDQKGVW